MAGCTHRRQFRLIAVFFSSAALGLSAVGCANAADGGRLGTVEVPLEISAEARADMDAELETVAAGIAAVDQSDRDAQIEASEAARVRVDQSTTDRWPGRIMAAALCVNMLATIWLSAWNDRRRRRKRIRRTAGVWPVLPIPDPPPMRSMACGPPKPPPAEMPTRDE